MTASELIQDFKGADVTSLPPIANFVDERTQILWVLLVGRDVAQVPVMTPAEISEVLRDVYGVSVSRQRCEGILSAERGTVAKRRKSKRRAYQLMSAGAEEIRSATPNLIFVDPAKALSKIREAQSLLADLSGVLRICDPYVDGRTLDYLADCTQASEIRVLTVNIKKETAFKRDVRAFNKERPMKLDVRVAPRGLLHDRYLIHDGGLLLFGTSLNSLGLKQSFVVALGGDIRASVLGSFEALWTSAAEL